MSVFLLVFGLAGSITWIVLAIRSVMATEKLVPPEDSEIVRNVVRRANARD